MRFLIYAMIAVGIIIMVTNIIRFFSFMVGSRDVLMAGSRENAIWENIAFALLVFFLIGYILIGAFGKPDLMVAGVLFGGSIFVAIVLTLMFRLVTTVKENALNIAETVIGLVDARDPNLRGHSRYVQNVTMAIYDQLPPEEQGKLHRVSLEFGALMHDVGKLGIPEQILNKPGTLTDEEWAVMRDHPRLSRQILEPLKSLREILPWVEYHHERIDGNGYYKVQEKDIPFAAKIIAVADTYAAITMRRSYKAPRTYEEAAGIMKDVAGIQLDRDIVDVFLKIPKEKLLACVPEDVEV